MVRPVEWNYFLSGPEFCTASKCRLKEPWLKSSHFSLIRETKEKLIFSKPRYVIKPCGKNCEINLVPKPPTFNLLINFDNFMTRIFFQIYIIPRHMFDVFSTLILQLKAIKMMSKSTHHNFIKQTFTWYLTLPSFELGDNSFYIFN